MSDLPITGIGTPILILLAVLSVISVAMIVTKTMQLSSEGKQSGSLDAALKTLEADGAEAALKQLGDPHTAQERVAEFALQETILERSSAFAANLEIAGNEEARRCFRHIRTLETIAMISPLLGLLGTVLGMIQAFQDLEMAEGAANASLLAGGIWQALLTTAAGLIVALPAAAAAALLSARAEKAVSEIEATLARIIAICGSGAQK